MSDIPFKRTGKSDLAQIESNIIEAFGNMGASSPLTGATLISGVSVAPGKDIAVPHKLGKKASGYVVVRSSALTVVYDASTSNPIPDKQLLLRATAAAVVSLLVF